MTKLAIAQTEVTPWGDANPRRGLGYHDLAIAFVVAHPIGTVLSATEFDTWAHGLRAELYPLPPEDSPSGSDARLAHYQRRFQFLSNLNKAGSHPRMIDAGYSSFKIDRSGQIMEVRSPQTAAVRMGVGEQIDSLVKTKRRQLAYLLQSADWDQLPPYERMLAEQTHQDISDFHARLQLETTQLSDRFAKLQHRMRIGIEQETISPVNGGIKQLLDQSTDDTEATEQGA